MDADSDVDGIPVRAAASMHTRTNQPLLTCPTCGETFRRREHIDRHRLRHTGAKPFARPVCHKSFTRRSVTQLLWHCSQSCAQLKQRCDGHTPCSRCSLRNVACRYVTTRTPADVASSISSHDASHSDPDGTAHPDVHSHVSLEVLPQDPARVAPHFPAVGHRTASAWDTSHNVGFDADYTINALASDSPADWTTSAITFPFPWPMQNWALPLDDSSFLHLPVLPDHSSDLSDPATREASALLRPPHDTILSTIPLPGASIPRHHLAPENVCGGFTLSCQEFPLVQPGDLQTAEAEMYGNVSSIPDAAAHDLHQFYLTQQTQHAPVQMPLVILRAFVELFLEHFANEFPCIHRSHFESPRLSWILLLGAAAVGCQYSTVSNADAYRSVLTDLLARAVESKISSMVSVDIKVTQSVFLLHSLWTFSGSHRDKVMLQHKRSSLAALCRDSLAQSKLAHDTDLSNADPERVWTTWLAEEEVNRLVACARSLESMGSLFLEIGPIISLRTQTRRWPCADNLWRCSNASEWHALRLSETTSSVNEIDHNFASRLLQIELFIDHKNFTRQIRASQSMRAQFASSITPFPANPTENPLRSNTTTTTTNNNNQDSTTTSSTPTRHARFGLGPSILAELDSHQQHEMAVLDSALYESNTPSTDVLFHVLGILRHVSPEILHAATGWQATKAQTMRSKARFCDFVARDGVAARKCLLHAYRIFRAARETTMGPSYGVYNLLMAVGYIYCFIELCTGVSSSSSSLNGTAQHQAQDGGDPGSSSSSSSSGGGGGGSRGRIVRLDQLRDRKAIDDWIVGGSNTAVLVTGVGLLNGADACARFLGVVEKTLMAQVAWSGICSAFAKSFAQLRRGETPIKNNDGDEDGRGRHGEAYDESVV